MKSFLKKFKLVVGWTIGLSFLFAPMLMLNGCGSTVQPTVGSGTVEDKTLSGNTVDFLTLFRVQNNYGNIYTIRDSDYGKVPR